MARDGLRRSMKVRWEAHFKSSLSFTASESQKYTNHRPGGYVRASIRRMLVHLEVPDKENLVTLQCLSLWCIHFSHRMFKFSQELAARWTARQFTRVTQSRRAWRLIHIKVTYYSIFIEFFFPGFSWFCGSAWVLFMVVFQLITTSCLLSYLVMPPPQWSGDRGLLFAWSNAWLLLVTRRSCLFQEPSGKSMVNVKMVTASLYFLPTSPLLCCPCWHHGGWRSTWGVWFKALILLLIAWCDAVSAVRQTL